MCQEKASTYRPRNFPGKKFPKNDAKAVDVALLVHHRRVPEDLGGHIGDGARSAQCGEGALAGLLV